MDDVKVDLRIVADEEVIGSIERELAAAGVTGARSRIVDPSYLGLDLSAVADLAVIVSVSLVGDPLLPALWSWLRPGSKKTRIVVETPFGRATFDSHEALDEAEVKEKLDLLVGAVT